MREVHFFEAKLVFCISLAEQKVLLQYYAESGGEEKILDLFMFFLP